MLLKLFILALIALGFSKVPSDESKVLSKDRKQENYDRVPTSYGLRREAGELSSPQSSPEVAQVIGKTIRNLWEMLMQAFTNFVQFVRTQWPENWCFWRIDTTSSNENDNSSGEYDQSGYAADIEDGSASSEEASDSRIASTDEESSETGVASENEHNDVLDADVESAIQKEGNNALDEVIEPTNPSDEVAAEEEKTWSISDQDIAYMSSGESSNEFEVREEVKLQDKAQSLDEYDALIEEVNEHFRLTNRTPLKSQSLWRAIKRVTDENPFEFPIPTSSHDHAQATGDTVRESIPTQQEDLSKSGESPEDSQLEPAIREEEAAEVDFSNKAPADATPDEEQSPGSPGTQESPEGAQPEPTELDSSDNPTAYSTPDKKESVRSSGHRVKLPTEKYDALVEEINESLKAQKQRTVTADYLLRAIKRVAEGAPFESPQSSEASNDDSDAFAEEAVPTRPSTEVSSASTLADKSGGAQVKTPEVLFTLHTYDAVVGAMSKKLKDLEQELYTAPRIRTRAQRSGFLTKKLHEATAAKNALARHLYTVLLDATQRSPPLRLAAESRSKELQDAAKRVLGSAFNFYESGLYDIDMDPTLNLVHVCHHIEAALQRVPGLDGRIAPFKLRKLKSLNHTKPLKQVVEDYSIQEIKPNEFSIGEVQGHLRNDLVNPVRIGMVNGQEFLLYKPKVTTFVMRHLLRPESRMVEMLPVNVDDLPRKLFLRGIANTKNGKALIYDDLGDRTSDFAQIMETTLMNRICLLTID